jgi:hypothetical protein
MTAPQSEHRDGAWVMACTRCGRELAPVLARLGSITCHDCRPAARSTIVRPS